MADNEKGKEPEPEAKDGAGAGTQEQAGDEGAAAGKGEEVFDQARAMALIAKLRLREKDADKAEKELQRIKKAEADKAAAELSETEKLKTQLAEAEAKVAELELKGLKIQAAEEVGLPAVFAERLQGENLEDLLADAKILLAAMPKVPKQAGNAGATNPPEGGAGKSETEAQKRKRLLG